MQKNDSGHDSPSTSGSDDSATFSYEKVTDYSSKLEDELRQQQPLSVTGSANRQQSTDEGFAEDMTVKSQTTNSSVSRSIYELKTMPSLGPSDMTHSGYEECVIQSENSQPSYPDTEDSNGYTSRGSLTYVQVNCSGTNTDVSDDDDSAGFRNISAADGKSSASEGSCDVIDSYMECSLDV